MAGIPLQNVLDHLRRLYNSANASQRSDRELLHAFAAKHDEEAFAVVVRRHAALVWGVCRRILGHHQDAEDAFQATFLILARRAGSVRWQASVGGWLHTVAQRLAVRARQQAEQRRAHEQEASRMPPVDSSLRELAAVVDEELRRLPAKYREPLLLHYLEGMTAEMAAARLGLSRTAFYHRLNRGREMLRERLNRQGLSLAAPLLAAALTQEAEAAAPVLIQATLRAVTGSVPERVAVLAAQALGTAAVTKLKIGLALGLFVGIAAGGVAMLAPRSPLTPLPQAERPADPPKADAKAALRVDRYGDPLPEGAVVRLGSLRFRAPAEIVSLAFAPDGKTLAVSSSDGSLVLMDAGSGKRIKRLRTVTNARAVPHPILFSPDGKCLIGVGIKADGRSLKGVVFVWELVGERKPREYDVDPGISWWGWSSESQPLAIRVAEEDGALHLHELAAGRSRRFACKDPPRDPAMAPVVACALAGNALALVDDKNVVHVWDIASGRERCTLPSKGERIEHLTFSPNGSRLVTRTGKAVQMWDTAKGNVVYTVDVNNKNFAYGPLVFTADGKTLALADSSRTIRFLDAATGKERAHTQEEIGIIPRFAVSGDGKVLATADCFGGTAIALWDVATGRKKAESVGHINRPRGIAFAPDGRRVATGGGGDGIIQFWNRTTGEPLRHIHRPGQYVRDIALSLDGRSLFSTWTDENVWISDAASGERRHVLKLEDPDRPDTRQSADSMHLSDDGKRLVAFSYYASKKDGFSLGFKETLITGWDTSTRKQLFRRRLLGPASRFVVSADARVLAEPHSEGRSIPEGAVRYSMRLEDLATGERLLTFPTLQGQSWPLAFSADGRLLASNTYVYQPAKDGKAGKQIYTIRLWEIGMAAEVLSLPAADYNGVAFSRDNRLMAVTAPNREIVVWDLALGREQRRFKGFDSQMIFWLSFSPDGRQLVSSFADSTLLIWDVGAPTPPRKLGAEEAVKAWADLASTDAPRAFRARGILSSAPEEAMPLLTKHLHPAEPADAQRLRQLLADLDSEQFAVRRNAQQELEKLGDLAEPALRRTMDNKPTLEVRRRVQALLERLRDPVTQPRLLQALRAMAVLEDIGTPEARRLLEELAKGAAEARLTREAKGALRRLDLRKP